MKKQHYLLFVCVFFLVSSFNSLSQNTEYIRHDIDKGGECRSVALSWSGVMSVRGKNYCSYSSIPESLLLKLKEVWKADSVITDVVIKSDGSWLLLYGKNGYSWRGNLPAGLTDRLKEANESQYTIRSADWDKEGDYFLITDKRYFASSSFSTETIRSNIARYGALYTVCMEEDGSAGVFCYSNGYSYYGSIPSGLLDALRSVSYTPYRIKIFGSKYFFASEDGNRYRYYM